MPVAVSHRDQNTMTDDEVLGFLGQEPSVVCATLGREGWPQTTRALVAGQAAKQRGGLGSRALARVTRDRRTLASGVHR